ncbi:MAG TPA: hypothetical protein VGM23_16375 [Armatimonadota bacterium]|jgi:hypothetical protein
MRNILASLLLGLLLAAPAAAQTARFTFTAGVDGFTRGAGSGTITQDTAAPLVVLGGGALKLEVAAGATELQVISPEFPIAPWMLYRLTFQQQVDTGVQLQVFLQYQAGKDWRSLFPIADPPGFLYATLPEGNKGRLQLILRVPGKSLGRAARVDNLLLQERGPLLRETGGNLYWDGAFERDHSSGDFTFWGKQPEKTEFRHEHPREGRWYFHVQGDGTYVVFPTLPVQPRRMYRWRCWVRGKGTIYPGLHKLAPIDWNSMRLDTAARVGWSAPLVDTITLKEDAWQSVEILAPCESEQVVWLQTYFAFRGEYVDIDNMEMRAIAGL